MPRRRTLLIALLLVAAMFGGSLWVNPSRPERDIVQERLDRASAALAPDHSVGQTFVAGRDGLSSIEVLLAVTHPDRQAPPDGHILLALERIDRPDQPPIQLFRPAAGLQHNQTLRFDLPPTRDSRYGAYRMTLSADGEYGLGVWYSSGDAYAYGQMFENGEGRGGDLRLVTGYRYTLRDALAELVALTLRHGRYLPALLILLFLPGLVLMLAASPRWGLDRGSQAALALGLSVAAWPLILLWSTVLGVELAGREIWIVVGALLAVGLGLAWVRVRRTRGEVREAPEGCADDAARRDPDFLPGVALALILLLTVGSRVLQVRELVAPAWVDSVHHTVITQLIVEQGGIPDTYEPYLPVADFHYHMGFHAGAAVLAWLTGLPTYQTVLAYGQALNVAAVLAAYALAVWLSSRRWAGVVAALVVSAISYMPAYYVSWGRYTQLAGLVVLAPLCVATSRALEGTRSGAWREGARHPLAGGFAVHLRALLLAAVLTGGLVLTHYRVLVFYALFAPLALGVALVRSRASRGGRVAILARGASLAVLAMAPALPWVVRFLVRVIPQVEGVYGGWGSAEAYGAFPTALIEVGWTRLLLGLAAAGVLWGIVQRRAEVILVAAWVGLWLLLANLHLLGLPDLWLVHNSSVVISYWLPVAALCGWLAADGTALLSQGAVRLAGRLPWRAVRSWVLFGATAWLALWGSWNMVDVINPSTVLISADDARAITWASENTEKDARFLINTGEWNGGLTMGTDGGWWLPILGQREVTAPNVFYVLGAAAYRDGIGDLARTVERAPSLDDPALLARLRQEGVTHVFVGTRGGRLLPKDLDASLNYRLLYASGPTRIYELAVSSP
ncbi:MAG: hypothetical protein ACYC5M_05355 [Anaerolineae bacterium]